MKPCSRVDFPGSLTLKKKGVFAILSPKEQPRKSHPDEQEWNLSPDPAHHSLPAASHLQRYRILSCFVERKSQSWKSL